jgi:transcriptional regulator with XRE-family HTH domain
MDIGKKAVRDFGKRVKTLRESRRWSQEQLAEYVGCESSYISKLETGKRSPSLPQIAHIAKALNLPIADLFVISKPRINE